MSYESPIKLCVEEMAIEAAKDMDDFVLQAIDRVCATVTVDRDEVLRALRYDRDQYDKGFADGKAAAMDELVRCAECRYYKQNRYSTKRDMRCQCWTDWLPTEPDDFCSYGEKRDD